MPSELEKLRIENEIRNDLEARRASRTEETKAIVRKAVEYAETLRKKGWKKENFATALNFLFMKTDLSIEEHTEWVRIFTYYIQEGKSDKVADELAWKELQEMFPRLKAYDGATPNE